MTAPRLLSPFVRTRTRLACTLGLVLAALAASLLPWWQPDGPPTAQPKQPIEAKPAAAAPRDAQTAVAQARRTGKPVLVETATTATEQTWALPNGRMRTSIHAVPQRAKNAEGQWAPIDNTLERNKNAPRGLGVRPKNPATPVRFSSGSTNASRADRSFARAPRPGDTVLAEMDLEGHTVTYTWPGALPEPVLDGPRALYPEVLPGVDLLVIARESGGFAQLLIVKNREASQQEALRTVTYGLRSDTAVFRYEEYGSLVRILDKAGDEVGSLPTPFAWDSSGRDPELRASGTAPRTSTATPADVLKLSGLSSIEPGARRAPVAGQLDGDGTGDARLQLQPAATGLFTDENVLFPVFIDPTMKTPKESWTIAYRPYPNSSFYDGTNFGSGTSDARVGHESDTGGLARSFWRMDFRTITGATVHKASFKVLNNHSWSCSPREFKLYLTGGISTNTTWNSQPSWATWLDSNSFAHGYDKDCPDDYELFEGANVTAAAQKGADNGWGNITFGLRATTESDTQTWRKFQASSAEFVAEYNRLPSEPTLVAGSICVQSPGSKVIATTSISVTVNAKDADGNLSKIRFRYGKVGQTKADLLITPNSSGTATANITGLVNGATYSWIARAEDSYSPPGLSTWYPAGGESCQVTIDTTAPQSPDVDSTVFPEATDDGQTWASVKFGGTGAITFRSPGATKFTYNFEGVTSTGGTVSATNGTATVSNLRPPHAGPNGLQVFAHDAVGNVSARTDYSFYVRPRDKADGPGDVGGDGIVDLLVIDASGNLRSLSGGKGGDLYSTMRGSYILRPDPKNPEVFKAHEPPAGYWYDAATNKTALISHYADVYPGDGSTDLFSVAPNGTFWLYPGDGYGTFNVEDRVSVKLPSNAPAPSTWTQLKAVGDVTGDELPDVFVRAGANLWFLSGYTGATFHTATQMTGETWSSRDIVNLADIDKDGTADLLFRDVISGDMFLRHGKPSATPGGVSLGSLMTAAASRQGDVTYGTGWTKSAVSTVIGIPDLQPDDTAHASHEVPDLWTRDGATGNMRVYYPTTTNTHPAVKTVLSVDWRSVKAFG
ncbi:FG-GAP-like repeat-containing protein [Streptomyces sp. NPDC058486]|uniref:FG-GAP-like repeat-containing protein n=1 Tax=Streptomyces sp. NPDC058486 TaxID=3346526 RepID=UPI0036662279